MDNVPCSGCQVGIVLVVSNEFWVYRYRDDCSEDLGNVLWLMICLEAPNELKALFFLSCFVP
jgi:hypothetical protein